MRMIGPVLVLVLVGLGAARARSAIAGETPSDLDPDTEIARRHFEKGSGFYNVGDYAAAITEFEAARRIKPLPALDYNIARCHDRMEHAREAIKAYERYLAAEPNASDEAEIRARIIVLRKRLAESAPAAPIEPAPLLKAPPGAASGRSLSQDRDSSPVSGRSAPRRLGTWVAGGAGAALLAGSLAAGLIAHSRHESLKSNCAPDGACDAAKVSEAQGWIDSGKSAGIASDVLLGVGAAAVVAGVALYFIEGRNPPARRAWNVAPTVAPHGGGLVIELAR